MSLWQCRIITQRGSHIDERIEVIDGKEDLTKYVSKELIDSGEACIVIQKRIPQPRTEKSQMKSQKKPQKKPWWKFW